ncbi:hypothetical protein [Mycobacteroides chelonae]|uniref:hypothetical protein n=1 Tax=Mycobacteroides chelonae TaxID=1774 RepID=UPI0010420199|nr:hypothetical protein [Mycobacteroides chelonae]
MLALWAVTLFAVCLLSTTAMAQPDDQTVKRAVLAGVAVFAAIPLCLATTIALILAGRRFLEGGSVRAFVQAHRVRRAKWGEASEALQSMLVMLEMADVAASAESRLDSGEFRASLTAAVDLHRAHRWVPSTDREVDHFVAAVNTAMRAYNKMIGDQIAKR